MQLVPLHCLHRQRRQLQRYSLLIQRPFRLRLARPRHLLPPWGRRQRRQMSFQCHHYLRYHHHRRRL
jgi:hypothetical protein